MRAFHSFWSKPNAIRNQGTVSFPDFELFTAILSALEWRRHNGPIKMITDSDGAEYFHSLGLEQVWDEIDTSLDHIDRDIDPFLFWAGGKLYALQTMEAPCVMLDTDLIIWKNVDWVQKYDVLTAHPEDLNPYVYPPAETFKLRDGYRFPEEWDFSLQAANTAFLYIADGAFKDAYVQAAISFFRHVETEGLNPVNAMCFAEQRVIAMCAAQWHQNMGYLISLDQANEQDLVTHTWGFKQVMEQIPDARRELCARTGRRILTDFPEMESTLRNIPALSKYLDIIY